jgi:hypothetical protein
MILSMRKSIHFQFFVVDPPQTHACGHKGCSYEGLYRAPKDNRLKEYIWFCLEHVRAYNALWNYGGNWSYKTVNEQRKEDVVWQRKTQKAHPQDYREPLKQAQDPFGIFNEEQKKVIHFSPDLKEALEVLGFKDVVSLDSLKKRYRGLVKKHHPDMNGGCKQSEEKLKIINKAYETVCSKLAA